MTAAATVTRQPQNPNRWLIAGAWERRRSSGQERGSQMTTGMSRSVRFW